VIIHDFQGTVIATLSKTIQVIQEPTMAEVTAVLYAIEFGRDGIQLVSIWSNCGGCTCAVRYVMTKREQMEHLMG
jgi:hypothetical protein